MNLLSTTREMARPDKIAQGPMISHVNIALDDFPWCSATAAALGVDHTHARSHIPTKARERVSCSGITTTEWQAHHCSWAPLLPQSSQSHRG